MDNLREEPEYVWLAFSSRRRLLLRSKGWAYIHSTYIPVMVEPLWVGGPRRVIPGERSWHTNSCAHSAQDEENKQRADLWQILVGGQNFWVKTR